MRSRFFFQIKGVLSFFLCAGSAVFLLVACSQESTRFSTGPFGNSSEAVEPQYVPPSSPPSSSKGGYRASSAQMPPSSSPTSAYPARAPIESSPLPAVGPQSRVIPPTSPGQHVARARGDISPPTAEQSGTWTSEGGMAVTVGLGDTPANLAYRYHIPSEVLLRSNGLPSSARLQPGSRIIIPVYHAPPSVADLSRPSPVLPQRVKVAEAHVVASPMVVLDAPVPLTRMQVASSNPPPLPPVVFRKEEKSVSSPEAHAQILAVAPPTSSQVIQEKRDTKLAAQKSAPLVDRSLVTASVPPSASTELTSPEMASPEFRWPAHGRIIRGFKSGANDGINISLPEGTPIKAAESGTVIYAGNELKGYGNLILIKHENGFVSAYANNGNLEVKRGEAVKRGQVIAKSGQSGNVNSPQLYFQLRKGQTPVDPTQYLAGM